MVCPSGAPATKTLCMTSSQYDDIVHQITAIMQDYKTNSPCTNNHCVLADFAGCVLRAAGHDFMDFRNNAGGSDGCLRFDDPDNKGLINCLRGDYNMDGDTDPDAFNKTLHDVYRNFCGVVSLADFIVIAGEAVMGFTETSVAVNLRQDFANNFMYGRLTSASCANAVALPNPLHGCRANEVTFLAPDAFNLTWRQTTALMGVHTIGKASRENSGYSGWWQDEDNVARFNNNYYISIVNHGWGPGTSLGGKAQWIREDFNHDNGAAHPEMMLNTDMCLAYGDHYAENASCCAWERYSSLTSMNINEMHAGEPIFCGFLESRAGGNLSSSFGIERSWCCLQHATECASRVGDNLLPQGPAIDAVHAFAGNQDLWLSEFKAVWKLATEKGAGRLNAFAHSCGSTPVTPAPTSSSCQVTLYEHWPAGITAGLPGLEAAESAWGGRFPTGDSETFTTTGKHRLLKVSNKASSVKVQGNCCKVYGYTSPDCSAATRSLTAIEATTQLLPSLPAGLVTPATGITATWGCNDCAQCVEVIHDCSAPAPAPFHSILIVIDAAGQPKWDMAYDPATFRFTQVGGDYYLEFADHSKAADFLSGSPKAGPVNMVQGGSGWSNNGGMMLQPNGDISRSDGSVPFHPNEAKWHFA